MPRPVLFLWLSALALLGCNADAARTCRVGADCASGACGGDGLCTAGPAPVDRGRGDGGGGEASAPGDGGGGNEGGPAAACTPNDDGVIERAEIYVAPGLRATYRTAANVTVDTAGVMNADGTRTWDFSGALAGDHTLVVETASPAGQWFSSDFPTATYTVRLTDASNLLGVFEITPAALLLRGVVSPADGTSRTKVIEMPAVPTLDFPLQMGSKWSTQTTASGQAQGAYVTYGESYASEVDAIGKLTTPLGAFHVLRVKVVLTRNVGGFVTVVRSFVFMADCFASVARVFSKDNETQMEFTTASEIQRLAP